VPGTTIIRSETRPPRSARTATGPWFIAGRTGTPDADANVGQPMNNLSQYAARFGSRAAHIATGDVLMFDAAEFYFREGGAELFVSSTADALDPALTAALALFVKDFGPGQVSAPGRTAEAQHAIIMAHAEANNRVPILDAPDSNVVATLVGATSVAGVTATQERRAAIFGPFIEVPGVTTDTTRMIPPSAIVAGIIARNDGSGISPNIPSAGELGQSDTGLDVKYSFSDADQDTLNSNGFNLLKIVNGGVRVYGYRTLSDPADATEKEYLAFSNARLFMAIEAELDAVAERFVFRQLDGQRRTISEFAGALTGVLLPYWQRGSLYGGTPGEAFRISVGPTINTDATMAAGELHAVIGLRMSPFGEEIIIELVKTRITEAL
jgi:phage tail sheath protein FI